MVKTNTKNEPSSGRAATKAFERAWKLLGKLEKRLAAARDDEARRRRQLDVATGPEIERRQAQLDEAVANAGKTAALLTELSELIAANARAQARQTVSDVAHEAAQAVKAEAQARTAAGPQAAKRPAAATRRRTTSPSGGSAPRAATTPRAATPRAGSTPRAARPAAPAGAAVRRRPVKRTPGATAGSVPGPAAGPAPDAETRPRSRRSLQRDKPDPEQSSG